MSVEKIRIEEVCDIYPLTSVQKGILYHSLCDGDGMYLENVSLRLHGSLCPEIVEKAWQAVTDHNDCLRTVFRWEGLDTPVQIVLKKVPIAMEFYTQKDTPPAVQFDLHQVPFLIRLVCLSELDYIMSIYTHHILLDGWSTSILIEEFIMFYSRIISGDKSAISNKKNEFKEYVYEADKNQNEYWNEYLHNYKEREFLPRSSPDELKNDSCPHCPLYFRIPKSEITNFSQKWKITLSALANACWALLYHTILGTEDVLFGTTVSTRTTEYSHSATGLFINTIPFRLKIDKKDTVLDILMKSLQSANSRLEYEKTSLSDIKKSVGFLDDQELFDTIVVVENYPVATAIGQRFGGLIIEGVTSFERNNYALCLGVDYKEEEVQFSFLYDSSAYTSKYVEKLMKQFEIIIRQVLIDPNKPLGQLSFIDQPQQIKIQRFSQNQFYEEKYSPNSILTNFDRVVALYADRIAIKFLDQTVTYRELSALTYVNGAMIASACREEPVVPLFFEKSLNFVIALLSVLRAGKAFYPIDPMNPDLHVRQRLATLGSDWILLTQNSYLPRLQQKMGISEAQLLVLKQSIDVSDEPFVNGVQTNMNTAYIMSTSGTTGSPKYIKISHQNVVHYMENYSSIFQIDETDIALGIPPISFDAFYEVLFSILFHGGKLVLPNEEVIRDARQLQKCIISEQCTIVNCSPMVLGELNKLPPSPYVRYYISGGDVLRYKHIDKLLGTSKVYNVYGPSEATMGSSYYEVTDEEICIGYPFPSHRIYLLNEQLLPVAIGSVGEICIGGPCVSEGYLNNPSLTQERFITYHGERVYRSGDKGKWDDNGKLHFLGRDDMQVKIRGYRIELMEINQALLTYEEVTEAFSVVVTNHDTKQVISYYVSNYPIENKSLEQFLKERLPTYMIPTGFIHVNAFPHTYNGKIDIEGLPKWKENRRGSFVEPANRLEEQIRELWANLLSLDVEKISVEDNFFELGGDSIISMQLAYKADELGLSIRTNDVFEYQTIRALAEKIRTQSTHLEDQPVELHEQILSPIQSQFFQETERHNNLCMQAVVLKFKVSCSIDVLKQDILAVLAELDELRIRFRFDGNQWLWRYGQNTEKEEIPVFQLQEDDELRQLQEIDRIANALYQTIDIEEGPLHCVAIFAQNECPIYLLLSIHHLLVDAYSWRLLVDAMENRLLRKQSIQFDHSSYYEWIMHQKRWANSNAGKAEYQYWAQLFMENDYHSIKKDYAMGLNTEAVVSVIKKEFMVGCMEKVLEISQTYGYSYQSIIIAALFKGLKNKFQTTHLIHVEGHGREGKCLGFSGNQANSIGWYTAIYPLFNDIRLDQEFKEIVKLVNDKLEGVPHRGVGYQIVKHMNPLGKKLKLLDQAEILISYLGVLDNQELTCFKLVSTSAGDMHAPDTKRNYALEIDSYIMHKQIVVEIRYSRQQFQRASMQVLLNEIEETLYSGFEQDDRIDTSGSSNAGKLVTYQLSPVQESILFHVIYNETNHVGIEQSVLLLKQDCNPVLLEKAWDILVHCHDSLRAKFVQQEDSSWIQFIETNVKIPFTHESIVVIDGDKDRCLKVRADQEVQRGFSLDTAPLMRFTMIKVNDDQYLIWTYHHLLLDGWCLYPLLQQLNQIYFALKFDREIHPECSSLAQYSNWISHIDQEVVREYWSAYFKDFTPKPLLTDLLPKIDQEAEEFCELKLQLDTNIKTKLEVAAKAARVTINTIIQGAWALVLHMFTGEQDVIFGVTSAGRSVDVPNINKLIGCFMNTLPFRVHINNQHSVAEYIKEVQQNYSQVRSYDMTRLSIIVDCANINRNSGLFDLYDSIVIVENYEFNFDSQSLFKEHLFVQEETGYPLTFYCNIFPEMNFKLIYNSGIVANQVARNILGCFENVITAMCENVDQHIQEIIHHITMNNYLLGAPLSTSNYKTYMDIFRNNLNNYLTNVAVVCGDMQLTYHQLYEKYMTFAEEIKRYPLAQEVIPILTNRSIDMIVAMLAVLEAGYAFTFIDASYPNEYVNSIIENIGGEYVITDRLKAECGDKELGLERVNSCGIAGAFCERGNESDDNIAYVVYTSGSTGRQKGIVVTQKSVVSHVMDMCIQYELTPRDHILQFSSISFDISLEQIFTALAAKSTMYIRGCDLWTPFDLAREINRNQLTVMNLPTSYWHQVTNTWIDHNIMPAASLRLVIVGGEAMSPKVAKAWMQSPLNSIKLMNAYGPAETVMTSTLFTVPLSFHARDFTPVGMPLANRNIHVERNGIPVPEYILGEIVFSGQTIAAGYWRDKEQTEKCFVFENTHTLYRSGDLGRVVSGLLEVVGRNDEQIKIRSHRIEINEVEARLMETSLFKQVAVVVHSSHKMDSVLVAFCVMKDCVLEYDRIKNYIPDYMMPQYFIQLDQLPQNHNNKIDKNKLRTMALEYMKTRGHAVESDPIKPEELKLLDIWKQVLQVSDVARKDDFFELGGNSLLAMKLVALIKKKYQVELPLQRVFEYRVFFEQASFLAGCSENKYLPAITKSIGETHYLATPQQKSIYVAHDIKKGSVDYNIPLLIHLEGNVCIKRLEKSLHQLLKKHESLRTTFEWNGANLFQQIHSIPEYKLTEVYDTTKTVLSIVDTINTPFDLQKDLLFRAYLVKARDGIYLFVNVHHIVCDGLSLPILINDLEYFYNSEMVWVSTNDKIQYKDYSSWFYNTLCDTESFKRSREFWINQFQTIPEPLVPQLPVVVEEDESDDNGNITYHFCEDVSRWISSFVNQRRSTEFSFLLSIMYILLYKYTNETDIVIGVPLAGRMDTMLEDVVGMFVNTLPFRERVDSDCPYPLFLENVQRLCTTILDYQIYPLEMLLEELGSDLCNKGLFDILFVYQNMDIRPIMLEGITCRYVDDIVTSPKYNLVFKCYREKENALCVKVEYPKNKYNKQSVKRFLSHYETIIKSIMTEPELRIKKINIMTPKEMEELNDIF